MDKHEKKKLVKLLKNQGKTYTEIGVYLADRKVKDAKRKTTD
jgi:hypothetical protein